MDPRNRLQEVRQTWSPPEELKRCRPRESELTASGKALRFFSIALIVGAVAAGATLYVKASADHALRQELTANGEDSRARVLRVWKTGGKEARFWAEYSYRVEDQTHRGRVEIGRRNPGLVAGSELLVRYLPGKPELHYLPERKGMLMPLWLPFLIAPAMMALGWLASRPLASQRLLLAEGRPAAGVVTHHDKAKNGMVAHFAFALLSGSTAFGQTDPMKTPPEPGTILCVLYEPDRVRHNRIYPFPLVRALRCPTPAPAKHKWDRKRPGSPVQSIVRTALSLRK